MRAHYAPAVVERLAPRNDHHVNCGQAAPLVDRAVLFRLYDPLHSIDKENRVDGIRRVAELVVVVSDGNRRRGIRCVVEGKRRSSRSLLQRPGDGVDSTEGIVHVAHHVAVDVRSPGRFAEAIVISRTGYVAEAVGDPGHVRLCRNVVLVFEAIALPELVRRPLGVVQVAVWLVGESTDGVRPGAGKLPQFEHVPRRATAIEISFALTQHTSGTITD